MLTTYLNGIDLSTHKVYIMDQPAALRSGPKTARNVIGIPGRLRSHLARIGTTAPRVLTLQIMIQAYTRADRQTEQDWLEGYLQQSVTFRWTDGTTTREISGTLDDVTLASAHTLDHTILKGSMTITCPDPAWVAVEPTVHTLLTTAPRVLTLGNVPQEHWVLTLFDSTGTLTNPVATIKDGAGVTLFTLTYTGAITSTQYLEVNSTDYSVRLYSASSYTNVHANWSGGFPALDPAKQPTVILSDGGGTAVGLLSYRARYA